MRLSRAYVLDGKTSTWRRESTHEFGYTDGDAVEQRIKQIVDECQDPSIFSPEIASAITDWPSLYHLGRGRLNLLWPFKSILSGDILEIGCGCGAITRALGEFGGNVLALEGSQVRADIAASRCRGLSNIHVVNDSFDSFEHDEQFDVVTLIGVLEYARQYFKPLARGDVVLEMLAKARSFLRPGGVLLLAIENQLGLKYLAGSPEDHNGKPMYGVEDLYGANEAVTFGEDELRHLLMKTGLNEQQWWYPFPDYKFPVAILSELGAQSRDCDLSPLLQNSVLTDPQRAPTSFSLESAWLPVLRNGLAGVLANSFVVLASDQTLNSKGEKVLAYHFASERREVFAKQVVFCESEAGRVTVRHQPLFAALNCATPESLDISFEETEFISGQHWQAELIRILNRPGWTLEALKEWAECWFSRFLVYVQLEAERSSLDKWTSLDGRHCDATPRNLIIRPDGSGVFFDQEWLLSESSSLGFLVFRSLGLSFFGVTSVARPAKGGALRIRELLLVLASHIGIPLDANDFADYVQRENLLQELVTGRSSRHFTLELFEQSSLDVRLPFWHPDLIAALESAVLRKDQDLGSLAEDVRRLEAVVREKSEALAQQAAEVRRLEAHVATKEVDVNLLGLRLHEAERAMQGQQLSQRQASRIETMTTELLEKETLMQTQRVELHARIDGLTTNLAQVVEGFEAERHYFYAEVAKRDNLLANATTQFDQLRSEFQNLSAELHALQQTRWFRLRKVLLFHPFGIRKLIHLVYIIAGTLVPCSLRAYLAPRLTRSLGLVTTHTSSTEDSGAYRVKPPPTPPRNAPRVVHVIANFMTGGSSRLVIDLVEYLGDRYRQCVLTSLNPSPPAYVGLAIEECRFSDSTEPFIEYYKRIQPDFVHVHYWGECDEPWYAKAIEAAGILGLPIIENINTPIAPYRSEAVAKYVYVSDYVRSVFGEADARHVTVYPGSDFNLFKRSRNEHAPEDCVGMAYRLERDKLNENAIQPFIRIAELRPSTKILIVGGGSLLDSFQAAVEASGVSGNFEFTGYVNYDVLPDLYRRMSIFVAPVWKESFGQVSPFAMSMKVPVIGYDIGAISEIIDTPGLVAPAGDADALARIAVRLLDSPEERQAIGEIQQQRAQANFSVQAMIDRYTDIYAEITNNVSKECV